MKCARVLLCDNASWHLRQLGRSDRTSCGHACCHDWAVCGLNSCAMLSRSGIDTSMSSARGHRAAGGSRSHGCCCRHICVGQAGSQDGPCTGCLFNVVADARQRSPVLPFRSGGVAVAARLFPHTPPAPVLSRSLGSACIPRASRPSACSLDSSSQPFPRRRCGRAGRAARALNRLSRGRSYTGACAAAEVAGGSGGGVSGGSACGYRRHSWRRARGCSRCAQPPQQHSAASCVGMGYWWLEQGGAEQGLSQGMPIVRCPALHRRHRACRSSRRRHATRRPQASS